MSNPVPAVKDLPIPELGMTLSELEARTQAMLQQIAAFKAEQRSYSHAYTQAERAQAYAQNLVHSEEEDKALHAILDAADANPSLTAPLAHKDGGDDDDVFETNLIRARFAASKRLQIVGEAAQDLATLLLDTAAHVGEQSKPLTQTTYRILKPMSALHDALKSLLAPAIDFYSNRVKRRLPK